MDEAIDLTSLEAELCRIPEVSAARVVAGAEGDIEEVHILSSPSKHAKQVVRDVQSVAMASFNIDLDRRVVSVVQLDDTATSAVRTPREALVDENDERATSDGNGSTRAGAVGGAGAPRIHVEGVSAVRSGLQCTAHVELERGEDRATGTAEGLIATSSVMRLVAQASIAALRTFEPAAVRADVESATVMAVGGRNVALVTVVIVVPPYEEVCSGSAIVRAAGELDAVARAVLDATNRRLPQLR